MDECKIDRMLEMYATAISQLGMEIVELKKQVNSLNAKIDDRCEW